MKNKNIRILIVEDEQHTRDVLVRFIPWKEIGVNEVLEASDGRIALEIARTQKPDIILSDIRMPKMNGIEFAWQLKEENKDCRFIFLSAYTDQEYLKSAIQIRAVSYVEKPINPTEIRHVVETAINEVLEQRKYRVHVYSSLRNRLCLAYAAGNANTLETEAALANVPIPSGPFLSASVRLYPNEALPWPEYEENTLLALLEERYLDEKCLFALKDPAHLIIHQEISSLSNSEEQLYGFLLKLQNELPKSFPQIHCVLSGIGSPVASADQIAQSYSQAVQAIRRSFLSSRPEIYHQKSTGIYSFQDSSYRDAIAAIRQDSFHDIQTALLRLQHRIRQFNDTPKEQVKQYYVKLLMLLLRRSENRPQTAFFELSPSFVEALGHACCLEDLTEILLEASDCFFRQTLPSENARIVDKAMDYILNHYENEDLNISLLASQLFLSSNYLSLLFKKETGKTIHQFITEVRIGHAREYLKDRSLSLNAVASMTGYHDTNYFSKVFKRETGTSPRAFREKL